MSIAEEPDSEGVLLLVSAHAATGNNRVDVLEEAVRNVVIKRRPAEQLSGTVEQSSASVAELRRRLFALAVRGGVEGETAARCLTLLDELREQFGAAENDPRHPDIEADRAWPIVS
jgi:hypothetical protein